jgi:hypothetical protein
MRILIDECIDERFRNSVPEHDCQTARYAGLAGLKNGDLLTAAETAKFDVLLTVDLGIEYQQNLTDRSIAIMIFRPKSNRLKDLLPHHPLASRTLNPFNLVRLSESKVRSTEDKRPTDSGRVVTWEAFWGYGLDVGTPGRANHRCTSARRGTAN